MAQENSQEKVSKGTMVKETQYFTPLWIVKYMVENSLGHLWIERIMAEEVPEITEDEHVAVETELAKGFGWRYYIVDAKQEPDVRKQLNKIEQSYLSITPDTIKCLEPCMGDGRILCYMFDVLMQIYVYEGWSIQDAVRSIINNNLYGLDIDDKMAPIVHNALLNKAREYDAEFSEDDFHPHTYIMQESNKFDLNDIGLFGDGMPFPERLTACTHMFWLVARMRDVKLYGALIGINVELDFDLLRRYIALVPENYRDDLVESQKQLSVFIDTAEVLSQSYHVICTNPPYLGSKYFSPELREFAAKYYPDTKSDLFAMFMERIIHPGAPLDPHDVVYPVWLHEAWALRQQLKTCPQSIFTPRSIV